uniref:Structural maintenance of chromosomes protein n=1 Tax=Mucochytrium quahogii TaxID=96639 RepID=A0A7S2SMC1_9STRA|mmetsp:Transcript_20998/g.34250  ORF Transcript_20998/g.34250 Transcript_20998/m.34250 type:complete len:1299 (+) Transcript_20998:22-3918(+)
MGRIIRIEVEDFKSYKGFQTIGPFKNFTAVIGPNGAGKSNLMDAISFVVGVQTRQLRGEQLKDLVYNADGKREEERRQAKVCLIYQPAAGEIKGVAPGQELSFERTISFAGSSKYCLQHKTVTRGEYDKKLKEIGVLVKARNFLVFQGDVEAIASKTPKELTKFFEDISSSGELLQEYDELKTKKDEAETDTIFTYQQKKGVIQEKKQAREQKDEADRFNQKLEQLEELKTEYFLLQLWQVTQDIDVHVGKIKQLTDQLAEISHEENVVEAHIEEKKKEAAKAHKISFDAEKEVRKVRNELADLDPTAIKATEAVSHLKRTVKLNATTVEKATSELEKQKTEKEGLTADIARLEKAEKLLQEKLAACLASSKISEEHLDELERVKEEARAKSVAARAKVQSLQRTYDLSAEKLTMHRRNVSSLTQRKADLVKEKEGFQVRQQNMMQQIEDMKKQVQDSNDNLEQQRQEFKDLNTQRTELLAELEKANDVLHNVKAFRAESRKERDMKDMMEHLKQHYRGGVKGRLVDLCTPSSRKYDTAISVALGRYMDAIVVDKETTGMECMKYLRDKRLGVAMFIPLDTIEVRRTQERHRQLGPGFRLAVDILEYDESLEKAIQHALHGVVICETLGDARDLCFKRHERVKAVTLGGHVISTNGDMTGGTSGGRGGKQQSRFEQKELDQAREKRNHLRDKMDDLDGKMFALAGHQSGIRQHARRGGRDQLTGGTLQDLELAVANAQNKLKFARMDSENTTQKLDEIDRETARIDKELRRIKPELQQLEATVSQELDNLNVYKKKVQGVENRMIDEFGKRIGVENIREAERQSVGEQSKLREGLGRISEQRSKLESQLRYVESRRLKQALERAEKKLVQTKAKLKAKEVEAAKVATAVNEKNELLDDAEIEYKRCKRDLDEKQLESREALKARDEVLEKKSGITKKLTGQENQAEKLRAKRHEILSKAELDQVHIPLKAGSESAKKRQRGDDGEERGSSKKVRKDDDSESSMSDAESSSKASSRKQSSQSSDPSSMGFSRSESKFVKNDEVQTADIDFSLIESIDTDQETPEERASLLKKHETKIQVLQEELEKIQPNMKARERYDDVAMRLKDTDAKLSLARVQSRKIELSFEKIKQSRYKKFMHMFEHVSNTIDKVYRELTKSSRHPLGGNAYLSLDNTEEPYLGGIKYNAMPPTKRFRDMDQLSGGEKTVAALALLFAVHSYHPAPFFVMDEVDAALDNVNVFKVSNYIRRNSNNFQCVVISLKDTFYDKADALVGIYREKKYNCSQTLTMSLDGYAENDNEEE